MNNQNKWNKELLYSIIFLIGAHIWFFFNPLDQIINLIESSPNELNIKYKLLDLGIFPILYNSANIAIIGLFLFLLCSIYAGVLSLRKASVEGEKKILGLIPKNINIPNIPSLLATLVVFVSLAYLLLNASIFLGLLD